MGAYFDNHPEPQQASLEVVAPGHTVVEVMPQVFERFDEWYNFRALPGEAVTVLMVIDETSYQGGTMGETHPHLMGLRQPGRALFLLGDGSESFADPLVLTHLGNGILWAADRS